MRCAMVSGATAAPAAGHGAAPAAQPAAPRDSLTQEPHTATTSAGTLATPSSELRFSECVATLLQISWAMGTYPAQLTPCVDGHVGGGVHDCLRLAPSRGGG